MMRSVRIPMATRFASLVMLVGLSGCGIYSFTGIDDSGAKTFAVDYLRTQTPLASETFAVAWALAVVFGFLLVLLSDLTEHLLPCAWHLSALQQKVSRLRPSPTQEVGRSS